MTSPQEIINELEQYHGTETYYRVGFGKKYVMTDGIKRMADLCECHWLIDIVWAAFPKMKKHDFQLWKIEKTKNDEALVTASDGNDNIIYKQKIKYTDFPLDSYEFYCINGSLDGITSVFVIMLKGQY